MGRDGFQLAESLGLKEAPGPFLTGCGNVPLTTDCVLGAGSGCCTLGKGAGRRLWGAEAMVTVLIGRQTPYVCLGSCEGGDGTADKPSTSPVSCNAVKKKTPGMRGALW